MSDSSGSQLESLTGRFGALRWLTVAAVVVALDQWTKWLIIENFAEFESVVLLPVLEFMRLHNEGAAFSFLAGASGWQRWLFIVIALAVSGFITWWLTTIDTRKEQILALGLALVLGGALGNLLDRVMLGYVVDFVLVHYGGWSFPAFNVADSSIFCGAVLVIFDGVFLEKRRRS